MSLKKLGLLLLDLVYPQRCPWCGNVQGFAPICPACEEKLKAYRLKPEPIAPTYFPKDMPVKAVYASFVYIGAVRQALLNLKYRHCTYYAKGIAKELYRTFSACGLELQIDMLVAVPASKKRLRGRGYNQSQMLAHVLAQYTGLPLIKEALIKQLETEPQARLNREWRLQNLRGAFSAKSNYVAGKCVLLIDDIVTTGSTLLECAKALYAAGAAEVYGLCVAAALPKWQYADAINKEGPAV